MLWFVTIGGILLIIGFTLLVIYNKEEDPGLLVVLPTIISICLGVLIILMGLPICELYNRPNTAAYRYYTYGDGRTIFFNSYTRNNSQITMTEAWVSQGPWEVGYRKCEGNIVIELIPPDKPFNPDKLGIVPKYDYVKEECK